MSTTKAKPQVSALLISSDMRAFLSRVGQTCLQTTFAIFFTSLLFFAPGHASEPTNPHETMDMESIYPSAKTCAACHPKQYSEWAVSQHAYAQMSPIYMAMQMRINSLTSGTNGDFCIRCHNQVGMNAGESTNISNLKRPASSREGITCSVCHRVNKSYGKISGRLPLVRGPMHSTIFGPSGGDEVDRVIADTDKKGFKVTADPDERGLTIHAKAEPFFELTQPGFCGTCHDVTLLNGFRLEEAFSEFKQTQAAENQVSCQDCHMGKVQGRNEGYEYGPAAVVQGIPTKDRRVTNHFFAGPDYSLIHPGIFPHNVEAAEMASLEDWLEFDWKAGWGTESFEEMAEIAEQPLDDLDEALASALEALSSDNSINLQDAEDAYLDLAEAIELEAGEKAAAIYVKLGKSLSALSESKTPSKELAEAALAAATHLRVKLGMTYAETNNWGDIVDREDAAAIMETQLERLEWAKDQRFEVMRNGYLLGDIQVAESSPDNFKFGVDVINGTDGHGVPTGFDAERLVFLQVTVTDSKGNPVFLSGDRDPNGDVRDSHSLYVRNGEVEKDDQLFNLQSKFIVRLGRGGEREQVLAVNTSVSALPFVRPEARATILYGRPLGARKHKKTIEPLGRRRANYSIDTNKLKAGETYNINVKLIAQMIPVHLIPAIQESGFDYNMTPKQLAEGVVEQAMTLWEKDQKVTLKGT
ncbi:MAG: multiheme c-type cytochrome [Alphaproteobacteria bacterium]